MSKRKPKKYASSFKFTPETDRQIDALLDIMTKDDKEYTKTNLFTDLIFEAYSKIASSDINRRLKIIRLNKEVNEIDDKIDELSNLRDNYTKELMDIQ